MPAGCESVAQVDDWMRDLGWFDARFIAIEVHNFAVAQRRKPQALHWVLQRLVLYQAHFARSGAKVLSVVTWNNAGFSAVALPSSD